MACDVSITFVDELRDFDVEKSGKNRRRRAKWSWFAAIAKESGSDVDRAVMGTKFRNNPRSMARTKKRLKIIIMGHRDSLSYFILSWFTSFCCGKWITNTQWLVKAFKYEIEKLQLIDVCMYPVTSFSRIIK